MKHLKNFKQFENKDLDNILDKISAKKELSKEEKDFLINYEEGKTLNNKNNVKTNILKIESENFEFNIKDNKTYGDIVEVYGDLIQWGENVFTGLFRLYKNNPEKFDVEFENLNRDKWDEDLYEIAHQIIDKFIILKNY